MSTDGPAPSMLLVDLWYMRGGVSCKNDCECTSLRFTVQSTHSSYTSRWVFACSGESTSPTMDLAPCLRPASIWQANAVSNSSTLFGCMVHTVHCLAHSASPQPKALDLQTAPLKARVQLFL